MEGPKIQVIALETLQMLWLNVAWFVSIQGPCIFIQEGICAFGMWRRPSVWFWCFQNAHTHRLTPTFIAMQVCLYVYMLEQWLPTEFKENRWIIAVLGQARDVPASNSSCAMRMQKTASPWASRAIRLKMCLMLSYMNWAVLTSNHKSSRIYDSNGNIRPNVSFDFFLRSL